MVTMLGGSMITKNRRSYNTPRKGVLTSVKSINFADSNNLRKGKPAQQPQPTKQNICCHCNRPGVYRVRWFYVCAFHAQAWGIA